MLVEIFGYGMSKWIFLILPFFTLSANTHCLCLMGDSPLIQTPFFKLGCQIWMKAQKNCNDKGPTFDLKHGDTLRIGYVGHWRNQKQTEEQITNQFLPLLIGFDIDLEVENTACDALSLVSLMKEIKIPSGRSLKYKGNQLASYGILKNILPFFSSVDIWAEIDFPSMKIKYPACQNYLNHSCSGSEQAFQLANCGETSEERKSIRCCPQDMYGHNWIWRNYNSCRPEDEGSIFR